jgi:hypothetical protein
MVQPRQLLLFAFICSVLVRFNGVAADDAALSKADSGNAVRNGDFQRWTSYKGTGVTTTSVGTPPNSLPDGWYGGPGVGATATYDAIAFEPGQHDVPGNPKRHLRVSWTTPPSADWKGESHHQPSFRFTFLEYFGIDDVRRFAGRTVEFRFYARVRNGSLNVVPIVWHSYDGQTSGIAGIKGRGYELFESTGKPGTIGVAQGAPRPEAVCRVTTRWQRFVKRITLPKTEGRSITAGHYTGVGFDLDARSAPVIDIANIEVVPVL